MEQATHAEFYNETRPANVRPVHPISCEFESIEAARQYRDGRGGWIFAEESGRAFVFALNLTRGAIFRGPWLRGMSGRFE